MPENRYLYSFLSVGGPGNQIYSMKEALIVAHYTNRTLLVPPMHEHYLKDIAVLRSSLQKPKPIFYPFHKLYKLNPMSGVANVLFTTSSQLTVPNLRRIHLFNSSAGQRDADYTAPYFLNQRACVAAKTQVYTHTRPRSTLQSSYSIHNLVAELERHQTRYRLGGGRGDTLQNNSIVVMKNLFNCIAFSRCGINGCVMCGYNPALLSLYKEICSKLDFSDYIKRAGDAYLRRAIPGAPSSSSKGGGVEDCGFVAVHLRYPDFVKPGESLGKATHNIYNEAFIYKKLRQRHGPSTRIFVATNKPGLAKASVLGKDCLFFEPHDKDTGSFASWIEQYICARSKVFYASPFNDFSKINKNTWQLLRTGNLHTRSTWSAFVRDYRTFFLNMNDKTANKTFLDFYK
jgi:hypothetical protein